MENGITFMRCVYYKGIFPDEYAISFETLDGQDLCFVDREDVVPNNERLGSNGNEGLVKVKPYLVGEGWGMVKIKNDGMPTKFFVPLEQLVVIE